MGHGRPPLPVPVPLRSLTPRWPHAQETSFDAPGQSDDAGENSGENGGEKPRKSSRFGKVHPLVAQAIDYLSDTR